MGISALSSFAIADLAALEVLMVRWGTHADRRGATGKNTEVGILLTMC